MEAGATVLLKLKGRCDRIETTLQADFSTWSIYWKRSSDNVSKSEGRKRLSGWKETYSLVWAARAVYTHVLKQRYFLPF